MPAGEGEAGLVLRGGGEMQPPLKTAAEIRTMKMRFFFNFTNFPNS